MPAIMGLGEHPGGTEEVGDLAVAEAGVDKEMPPVVGLTVGEGGIGVADAPQVWSFNK